MPPNHIHKIILSSALYYQNLHVIREYDKTILTIKNVTMFLTTSYGITQLNAGKVYRTIQLK